MSESLIEDIFGLRGRIALVTGGASGIGKAIADLFVRAGARVVIGDKNKAAAEAVCAQLAAVATAGLPLALELDVADEASVKACFAALAARVGVLDVCVNNAGIYFIRDPMELTVEEWDRVNDVNARGLFLCLREAVRAMSTRPQGGSIVNISSSNALKAVVFGNIHYGASKGAVNNITQSAALEYAGRNIRINAIMPGPTSTEGAAAARASGTMKITGPLSNPDRVPLGRRGEVLDIAKAALFLAGDGSSYITGELISVDGGFHIS